MREPLSFAAAAALLEQVRLGRGDLRSTAGYPLLVVNLEGLTPQAAGDLRPATGWPVVVVGCASGSPPPGAAPGLDVLLTESANPPPPWVSASGGIEEAVQELDEVVSARTQASTTLAQVLRSTENSTVGAALVVESLAYAALQGGTEHRKWLEQLGSFPPDRDPAPCVLLERDGPTLCVSLNRPSRRNAYSSRMRDELIEALELAAADESITRVDLRGNGPNFSSGGDLAEFGDVADTATAHWIRMQRSAGWWIHHLHQRTVVHVHGACVGAGVELPAFAGAVVAAPDTTFALPEVKMGLIPGAGGTASVPRRIGRQRTAWLALTGRPLGAEQALEWGLIDRLSDSAG